MREKNYLILFIVIGCIIFSCGKERSCENCRERKVNKPPLAIAGPDQVIILPVDSVVLDGRNSSDPEGAIANFQWAKISGPAPVTINNPVSSVTKASNLVKGIYQFELTVTDSAGLSATDTVKITVNPQVLNNEVILDSLTWSFWHDLNDPSGVFDVVYISIPDTANILSNSSLHIYVKLDSTSSWVLVNPVINGNCTFPYTYELAPTANNTLVLFITDCAVNQNLVGTRASVKIN